MSEPKRAALKRLPPRFMLSNLLESLIRKPGIVE